MKRTIAAVAWLALLCGSVLAWDTKSEPVLPDGKPLALILPASEHMRNVGGSDGAGLCVYTSVTLSAKWHNITEAYQLRKFAEGRPGGSYPEKLAADLKTYAQRYNVKLPAYVQHTGGEDAFLDLCLATRRYPGITYAGKDDFYDSTIAHMVNMVNLDKSWGTIQDNNRAGKWTTDTRQKVLNRWKGLDDNGSPLRIGRSAVGGGWAFVWLAPPAPPPAPRAADDEGPPAPAKEFTGFWERTVLGDSYSWERWDRNGNVIEERIVWVYWVNGEPTGGFWRGRFYSVETDPRDGSVIGLGAEKACPCGLCPPRGEPTDTWNKGVETDKVSQTPRYWLNETECSRERAYAAVLDTGDGLVDDSDKYHLSVIGERNGILALFAPGGFCEKYTRRLHVQVYTADSWVAKTLLQSAVTLQEPAKIGGAIVGKAQIATDSSIQAILSAVFDPPPVPPAPAPRPDPVPSPHPMPDPIPAPTPAPNLPAWLYALLAALGLAIWRKQ